MAYLHQFTLGKAQLACHNSSWNSEIYTYLRRGLGVITTSAANLWRGIIFPTLLVLVLFTGETPCQLPGPRPPKEYQVQLRYQIFAARNDRLKQFFALTDYLKSIGFQKDEGPESEPEDPSETRMTGAIASANARKMLADLRVKSLLLMPVGYQLPEEANKPVKIQMELAGGFELDRQRVLSEQVKARLERLGFREAVGYHHRGFTRLAGTIPAGELETLLKDLRWLPGGWLASDEPITELPSPLKNVSPILLTEVLPEPEGIAPAKEPPALPPAFDRGQEHFRKISPELRALAIKEDADPLRMEIFLKDHHGAEDRGWKEILSQAAPGLVIEGRVGPLITALSNPRNALALAELPMVSVVRLPRAASLEPTGNQEVNLQYLRARDPNRQEFIRRVGGGVRLAIVAADFRGYDKLLGKRLPAGTRYLDLTAERNATLLPDEFASGEKELGHGTRCALELASRGAELTLIRIAAAAPHQMEAVAKLIRGEQFRSASFDQRRVQLIEDTENLRRARERFNAERKAFLDSFGKVGDEGGAIKTPAQIEQEMAKRREELANKQTNLEAEEKELDERYQRFVKLDKDLKSLKGIQVVVSALVWNDGYPVGGGSALSRHFDDRNFRAAQWLQLTGAQKGQAWSGLFRDADNNGVMEFVPAETRLKPGRWTHELNFLAWQPFGKEPVAELPEKAKVRLSIQWREAHDAELARDGQDHYLDPLAKPQLVVLRQRDPSGRKLPIDEFEVVARSEGLPQRLDNQPTHATYEQVVEFTTEPGSRYALRVEGKAPESLRPTSVPTLSAHRRMGELRPRIFVDVVNEAARKMGRPVFIDYGSDTGLLGMPADAQSVIPIGSFAGPESKK